jgi:ubiquinone/menaquinone biosynthesis C-methylase UbiE
MVTMEKPTYGELARYYDLIYNWKDYRKESQRLLGLISKYKESTGRKLLDVGCGTGTHLIYFTKKFDCTGIDLNQSMLTIAKKKLKDVKFVKANMTNFKIGQRFDVITCLFSAIGHVKTYSNLNKTITCFSKHLRKGGVVIIEPWFTKQKFRPGTSHLTIYEAKGIKIVRLTDSQLKNNNSILEMHYLIAEKNKKIKYFIDRLDEGLFDTAKTLKFLKNAGFKALYLKSGLMNDRGLYIGVKIK